MYFGLSEDQLFFQDNVSRFLEDHASLDVIKKITEGEGQNLQKEIDSGLVNLGINGLLVPEEYAVWVVGKLSTDGWSGDIATVGYTLEGVEVLAYE